MALWIKGRYDRSAGTEAPHKEHEKRPDESRIDWKLRTRRELTPDELAWLNGRPNLISKREREDMTWLWLVVAPLLITAASSVTFFCLGMHFVGFLSALAFALALMAIWIWHLFATAED